MRLNRFISERRHGETQTKAMTQRTKSGAPPRSDRADRLRAALRENLKRRKAQAKGRAHEPEPQSQGEADAGASSPPSAETAGGRGAG